MTEELNDRIRLAGEFVNFTSRNIFLTGKAGTGKTTFLRNLVQNSPKRMVVVAPTGVAAINAGGVTIHSFFQLSFGPQIPEPDGQTAFLPGVLKNSVSPEIKKFNRTKIRLIQSLDLLIIDEISMVRSDMLDAIDAVLRRFRNRYQAFGGVQLLMIGDLHQLAPIVKEDEWDILRNYYDTVFFFGSRALQKTSYVSIELEHIFRQSDHDFIQLLNSIRNNCIVDEDLQKLNERCQPAFEPKADEGYIILTTHNATAKHINDERLKMIKNKEYVFKAIVENDFPEYSWPTEAALRLKKGTQVMFVKNDSSYLKRYYNGKIGKITYIDEDCVKVMCPGDYDEIDVGNEEWNNISYYLDEKTKEVQEKVIGKFIQLPLKPAWAITIHKSQGLTFDKAIIDARSSFAHGQVYVALSRCRSLEGIVLLTPIAQNSIITDHTISGFTNSVQQNIPDTRVLQQSKKMFQESLVYELFDFTLIAKRLRTFKKLIAETLTDASVLQEFDAMNLQFENEVLLVASRFKPQLQQLCSMECMPEENAALKERIVQAGNYFIPAISGGIYQYFTCFEADTDNQANKRMIKDAAETLQKEIFVVLETLKAAVKNFDTLTLLHSRANAGLNFVPVFKKASKAGAQNVSGSIARPELYAELKRWRKLKAGELNVAEYMILQRKTMLTILEVLPENMKVLKTIKGIGSKKIALYGEEIISLVEWYCEQHKAEK